MFRLLVLLLIVSSSAQFAGAFKPNLPPAKDTQVLVVGANGRIGEQVVNKLSKQGFKVRAMVRKLDEYYPLKSELGNGPLEVVVGDVLDVPSLESAMAGCTACIDCHGSARSIEPWDLFIHPKWDPKKKHPFLVSYVGTKNLVDAGLRAGCKRMVRITGHTVGMSAFHPLSFWLNFFLSMCVKWQYESEKLLREAKKKGMNYTIVRPGQLMNRSRPRECSLNLSWDGKPLSKRGSMPFYRIGRRDVADLLVAALQADNAAGATLSCSWSNKPNGPKSWKSLLAKVTPDKSPLPKKFFRVATLSMGGILVGSILSVVLKVCFTLREVSQEAQRRRAEFYGYADQLGY